MALSAAQILDIRGDLAIGVSGASDEIFTDTELDRLYTRAGDDYNLAVYYGWRQIAADSARWINYQVAQTKVDRNDAANRILRMLSFWAEESRIAANQVRIMGAVPTPTKHKPKPLDTYPKQRTVRRGIVIDADV
jgi:hypothetical protein